MKKIDIKKAETMANLESTILNKAIILFKNQKYSEALELFKILADNDNSDAMLYIGYIYEMEFGVKFNDNIIRDYYSRAASKGNKIAKIYFDFYKAKITGELLDFPEMKVHLCLAAAQNGHAEAQFELFRCYYLGEGGTTKNYQEAAQWLIQSANNNFNRAQGILGECYLFGSRTLCIEKNYSLAIELLTKSSQNDNAPSLAMLGYAYLTGKGVDINYHKATILLRSASERKEPMAQYLLGECYFNGWGLKKDNDEAIKLYVESAKNSYQPAATKLEKLNLDLSELFIPNGTTIIENFKFHNNTVIKRLIIPEGVTSIGSNAFAGCTNLRYISIPDTVENIGASAFADCISLESINLPPRLKVISAHLFWQCKNLKTIKIPDTISSIENAAFYGCECLDEVLLPSELVSLGNSVFDGCAALHKIVIPKSIQKIGNASFSGCHALKEVACPDNLNSIGDFAFCKCVSLQEISFPSCLEAIGDFAFSGCCSLNQINIPSSLKFIGRGSFDDCTALKSVVIQGNITYVDIIFKRVFDGCVNINYIKAKAKVVESLLKFTNQLVDVEFTDDAICFIRGRCSSKAHLFTKCSKLRSIVLQEGIRSLPKSAFAECENLVSAHLPTSLLLIKPNIFKDCKNLTEISIANASLVYSSAFKGCSKLITEENGIGYVDKWVVCCDKNIISADLRPDTVGIAKGAFADCSKLSNITIPKCLLVLIQK